MTDIDRLIIIIIVLVVGYFFFLLFKRKKDSENETDIYPWRLSTLSGDEHFKKPAYNLEENLDLKYKDAMLSYENEKFAEAIEKLTECISDTKFSEFYYFRGICYFAIKEYQLSIADWETAIILFPDYEYELSSNIREAKEIFMNYNK